MCNLDSSILKKKILFVVSGYSDIGMGHVYRTVNLADELRDSDISFLCTHNSKPAEKYIKEYGYFAEILSSHENLIDSILEKKPDMVINDFLDTKAEYIIELKRKKIKSINFEDKGEGAKHADAVINALYDNEDGANVFYGHRYFELRDEFLNAKKISIQQKVKNIVITFGGSDNNNLTLRTLKIIKEKLNDYKIKCLIITGSAYIHDKSLENFFEIENKINGNLLTWIKNGTKNISTYLEKADMVITSCGRTPYELAHLLIPTIVIAANERETLHNFPQKTGMSYLGRHDLVADDSVIEAFITLMDYENRKSMHENLSKFDLTEGKYNVLKIIKETLDK